MNMRLILFFVMIRLCSISMVAAYIPSYAFKSGHDYVGHRGQRVHVQTVRPPVTTLSASGPDFSQKTAEAPVEVQGEKNVEIKNIEINEEKSTKQSKRDLKKQKAQILQLAELEMLKMLQKEFEAKEKKDAVEKKDSLFDWKKVGENVAKRAYQLFEKALSLNIQQSVCCYLLNSTIPGKPFGNLTFADFFMLKHMMKPSVVSVTPVSPVLPVHTGVPVPVYGEPTYLYRLVESLIGAIRGY